MNSHVSVCDLVCAVATASVGCWGGLRSSMIHEHDRGGGEGVTLRSTIAKARKNCPDWSVLRAESAAMVVPGAHSTAIGRYMWQNCRN